MTTPPLTAFDLKLMAGRPVPPAQRVTHGNQLLAPYNRWSFQNELKLNRTSDVWRGCGPAADWLVDLQDLTGVTYQNRAGERFGFDEMVEQSHTDGMVVLHRGRVIYERYLNGMDPYRLHAWASASKSMVGVLAEHCIAQGLLDPSQPITHYLPLLGRSGFAGATVQQALDMTTAVGFADDDPDPVSESRAYAVCMGWRSPEPSSSPIESIYDYLPRMKSVGVHGEKLIYQTPNTDVVAWILTELTGRTLSELTRDVVWSSLGADRDAFWIVNPEGVETAGSGLVTTTRDLARFGQWVLSRRRAQDHPRQAVTPYHNFWWTVPEVAPAFQALGYGGQMLFIAPDIELVVAKFSSFPTPTEAGNEFYSAMGAFPALVRFLAR